MNKECIVAALKAGKEVTFAGRLVTAEGINYSWQEPVLWVNNTNGSSYRAGFREIRSMKVPQGDK